MDVEVHSPRSEEPLWLGFLVTMFLQGGQMRPGTRWQVIECTCLSRAVSWENHWHSVMETSSYELTEPNPKNPSLNIIIGLDFYPLRTLWIKLWDSTSTWVWEALTYFYATHNLKLLLLKPTLWQFLLNISHWVAVRFQLECIVWRSYGGDG